MINVAASWGLYGGPLCIAPMELWEKLFNTDLWKEKQKRKEDRTERGYSEYGSLNYPWMCSLAGDLDVFRPDEFGLFNRGWKVFSPEMCEMEE